MRRLPAAVNRLPLHVRLSAEIEALEPAERQVLSLCLLDELTPLEAAGALKRPVREIERTLVETLARLGAVVRRGRRSARRAA
jgi:DNA-directed RNA polymerase specialized sigma24 family protein